LFYVVGKLNVIVITLTSNSSTTEGEAREELLVITAGLWWTEVCTCCEHRVVRARFTF
uniref:Secreted protein n=1 Tax=Haemonchus placei TaxID=6290 RepID=A0A0N4XAS4_HAEPC